MSGVRGGWCVDRGGRLRFIKVATQNAPPCPDRALARSRPRSGRGSFLRRAAHQARIGPCVALFVGISTAGNRPMSTNWRHAAAGRAGLHTPPDPRSEPEGGTTRLDSMAPVRRHLTSPGSPDAYKRCSARNNPRLVRGAPSKRTAAAARPRWCKGSIGGSICVATLINRGLLPLPATSHLSHHSADLLY